MYLKSKKGNKHIHRLKFKELILTPQLFYLYVCVCVSVCVCVCVYVVKVSVKCLA